MQFTFEERGESWRMSAECKAGTLRTQWYKRESRDTLQAFLDRVQWAKDLLMLAERKRRRHAKLPPAVYLITTSPHLARSSDRVALPKGGGYVIERGAGGGSREVLARVKRQAMRARPDTTGMASTGWLLR